MRRSGVRILGPLMFAAASLFPQPGVAQSIARTAVDSPPGPIPPAVMIKDSAGHVTLRATRVAQPIKIDGKLDDAIYAEVQAITDFIQQDPNEGAPISEKTEMWVLYDDRNIYVSCRCSDEHPERIVANEMRRDGRFITENDNITVGLDTFHDLRNGNVFYVTAAGGMRDTASTDERINNSDFNTVWDAKVGRFEGGWVVEIAIPFKSLRYRSVREQVWGINLRRSIRAKNEAALITRTQASWGPPAVYRFSSAATLVGLETPPASKNLEIKPYAISRVMTDLVTNPAVTNDFNKDAGFDVKYGISRSLTADFTYNTDFAQVEVDEAQINLTRFNVSYPEKREFFLEGQGLFAFGGGFIGTGGNLVGQSPTSGSVDAPTLFYSRAIGLSGGRPVPIVGGARLTGKVAKWSIGALNIESDRDAAARAARTNFTVMRVRRDLLRRSAIGALYTRRSVSTVGPGSNEVFGVDGTFSFFQNVYLSGFASRSRTEGLRGKDLAYRAQFNYAGDRYGLEMDRLVVSENFNPEVGFLRRRNFRRNFAAARFSPRPEQADKVRRYFYESSLEYTTDNNNRLESRELRGAFRTEFQSSDVLHVEYFGEHEVLPQPFEIVEGTKIPVGAYSFNHLRTAYSTGQQHRMSGTAAWEMGSFYAGEKKTATLDSRVAISRQLAIEPNISLNWVSLPQGDFSSTIFGGRTTFTVTPWMFVAALVQYASSTSSFSANLRFRWEYQPGSELFVVYTEGRDTLRHGLHPVLENRGFAVKINRLIRF